MSKDQSARPPWQRQEIACQASDKRERRQGKRPWQAVLGRLAPLEAAVRGGPCEPVIGLGGRGVAPQGRGCLPPLARLGSRSEVPVALASSRDVTARAEAGAGLLGGRPRAGAAEVTVAPYRQCQATALAACPDDAGHGAGRPVHHPMPREGGAWARGKGGKGEVRSWRRGACRAAPSLRPPRATGQCACRFMFMSCDVASGAAAAGWGAMQRGGARGQGTRVRADTCQG